MRESEHLREDMEFQLNLLRLMTVPHQSGEPLPGGKPEGAEQLERLFQLTEAGYRN